MNSRENATIAYPNLSSRVSDNDHENSAQQQKELNIKSIFRKRRK